jgi:CheY-like chemotaxis protein
MKELKEPSGGRARHGRQRIYLVDDEPMLLELGSVILEPNGYAIETFSSPQEALRAYEVAESKPALIITDFAMDRMTGLDLAVACRRLRPGQKVLMVSGTVGPETVRNSGNKLDGFLAKPYEPRQLVEAVESILGN